MKMKNQQGSLVIYKSSNGKKVEVRFEGESLWLTAHQIADLFDIDRSGVVKHIGNIYKTKELSRKSTCAKNAQVARDGRRRIIDFFNLDVIVSVGYRVNSKRGTAFRVWASKILKHYLIQGYAINEKKIKRREEKILALQKTVNLLSKVIDRHPLETDEAVGLLKVVRDYTYALDLLDQYDNSSLQIKGTSTKEVFKLSYEEAKAAINELGRAFHRPGKIGIFGIEKDDSFKGSLYNIYQTFDKKELYPSIEEKASHLLYFVIKDHSFIDGNKRIAAFLFVWFLEKNKHLYRPNGGKRIDDNALVAICLMIAESHPDEKETIIKLLVNLINKRN
jgi:prophage maintenance system killer protein